MWGAYRRIRALMQEWKPDVLVGTGGYVTVPAVLAAASLKVPVLLQEQNSIPGRANRFLARFAREIHIHFTETRRWFRDRGKLRLSGNPVRVRIPEGRALRTLQSYRLFPERKTVLFLGGSQGAHSLNTAFREMLPRFRSDRAVQFVVQTGKDDYRAVLDAVRDADVKVVVKSFLHNMEEMYGVAHLVVARAGAMTVTELCACGIPSILVPYPHATADHQTANANALVEKGAAVLLPDRELSGEKLAETIRSLLADPVRLREMKQNAFALSRPDSALHIAEAVERLGGGAPEAILSTPEQYDLESEEEEEES
jgi:UDP-N-acetylglucosamine--N-acetylmuramyl-(pentapeptide) pyrophosphoryl-undecaprenol N-acetylglucosamine transferase